MSNYFDLLLSFHCKAGALCNGAVCLLICFCHLYVESCLLTKLDGGLEKLHTAHDESVDWLSFYGTSSVHTNSNLCVTLAAERPRPRVEQMFSPPPWKLHTPLRNFHLWQERICGTHNSVQHLLGHICTTWLLKKIYADTIFQYSLAIMLLVMDCSYKFGDCNKVAMCFTRWSKKWIPTFLFKSVATIQ